MQKKPVEKLKKNILSTLSFLFIVFSIIIMYLINYSHNNIVEIFKNNTEEQINKTISFVLDETTKDYEFIAQRLDKEINIGKYISENKREQLYEILEKKFIELKKDNNFLLTIHVVKDNGVSFVRAHKKEEFGDNVAKKRPLLDYALKNKTIISGYETGIHAFSYRVIVPIYLKDKFMGTLGIGIHPDFIMEKTSKIIQNKGALFIDNNSLKSLKKFNKNTLHIQNHQLLTKIDKPYYQILEQLSKEYKFQKQYQVEYENNQYLLYTIDISNKNVNSSAKFIFIQDITKELNNLSSFEINVFLLILLCIISTYVFIRIYFLQFSKKTDNIYSGIITKLRNNENMLKAIEDNSPNIIITTFGNEIFTANKQFFDFFEFNSLKDFKKDYQCISELFVEKKGFINKSTNNKKWIEAILKNKSSLNKVVLLDKQKNEKIFKITASDTIINGERRFVVTLIDITDVEDIKNRLTYAINGSQDGLWDWNLVTDEVYFSPRWKEMLGYLPDELPNELDEWGKRVHPDDLQKALDDIKANHDKKTKRYENIHRLKHKDGHWVWIHDRGQTLFDSNDKPIRMLGFHTDITKQIEEKEILQIEAKRAKALLDIPKYAEELNEKDFMQKGQEIAEDLTGSKIAFIHFVNDDEQTIELVTWSNRTLHHYCKVESMDTHYPVNQAGIWADALRQRKPIVINDYPNYTKKLGMPEGHAHLERFISVPVIENNKVVMLTGVGNKDDNYKDIDSETVQLVSNIIWQSVQRKRAIEEILKKDKIMLAQSRNAAMGEMISMIAHQWRQPLAIISMGANNILADIELGLLEEDELKDSCKEIIEQTKELSTTIDDFKNFFKPQKLVNEDFISSIFDKTFGVVGKALENNGINIKTNIDTNKKIKTYTRELMQVFINIINNAKEILVLRNIENKLISIDVKENEKTFEITIQDNGKGISLENIEQIFEPYFSTKDEKTGTGLGLYMSKVIVEKHLKGSIEVSNQKDGAQFKIILPDVIE